MPTVQKEIQTQQHIWYQHTFAPLGALQPPAPPCPENGMLPAPFSSCGVPEAPATTLPYPGNMAYWGGHVQASPHIYIVYWGWGETGAFPAGQPCTAEKIAEGTVTATLKCDPDGAGRYMADFVHQLGGTQWAGEQTQYYQTVNDPSGNLTSSTSPTRPTSSPGSGSMTPTRSPDCPRRRRATPPAPATPTPTWRPRRRARRRTSTSPIWPTPQFIIAQPANYSDPNAVSTGYCAFHDYTYPGLQGGIYNGLTKGISYTNMPYALSINSGGANVCGKNAVNSGAAGNLDGFSIVLGHEIEETVTDPGAEDILGSGTSTTNLGGWYDSVDANENGDKCAWVGEGLGLPGEPTVTPVPGAINDIKGNLGKTFAVQSLWSNQAAEGAGYCAGAGNDLPQPLPPL